MIKMQRMQISNTLLKYGGHRIEIDDHISYYSNKEDKHHYPGDGEYKNTHN